MSQHLLTDQIGVRFGIGAGVLFSLTGVVVAGQLEGAYGVALLLGATGMLSAWLDGPHAIGLGVAGWAFATGFSVNTLGVLTLAPIDLLRLVVFVLAAKATSRFGDPA
jgi:hypothetical protein